MRKPIAVLTSGATVPPKMKVLKSWANCFGAFGICANPRTPEERAADLDEWNGLGGELKAVLKP